VLCLGLLATACKGDKAADRPKVEEQAPDAPPAEPEPEIPDVALPADTGSALALNSQTRTGVLPNGLTYFIRENRKPEERAELRLAVDAGSVYEEDNQRGLAHFLEHMAFNGTKSFPKHELTSTLEKFGVKFGAHINAATGFDETMYMLKVPTDKKEIVETSVQILREWASDISLDPAEVEAERGVALSEKRGSEGMQQRITEQLIGEILAGTPYPDRLPIGTKEVIKNAPPQRLRDFYTDWYRPDNMAVIAVGDFNADEMETMIKDKFGSIPKAENPRKAPDRTPVPISKHKFVTLQDKEIPVIAVGLGRVLPRRPNASVDDFRRKLTEMMALGMLSKRIEEAQKRGQIEILAGGGIAEQLVRSAEVAAFFALVRPGQAESGFQDLLTELERARRHGFTQGEIDRFGKDLVAGLEKSAREEAAGKEDSAALAEELMRHFYTGELAPGRAMELAIARDVAKSVTPAEAQASLKNLLDSDALMFVAMGPTDAKLPSEQAMVAMYEGLANQQVVAYADKVSDEPLIKEPPTPGTIAESKHHESIDVHEWTLSNGARVLLKPTKFKKDEVVFSAVSPGGTYALPAKSLGPVLNAAVIVDQGGAGNFDSVALERALAGRQVNLAPFISDVAEGFRGSSTQTDLETFFQLFYLSFTAPRKDPKLFSVWKENTLSGLELQENQPAFRFQRLMQDRMMQKNPRYVSDLYGKNIKAVNLEASFELFQDRIQDADDFTFFLVGSFELDAVKPLVLRYIGSLERTERSESFQYHETPAPTKPARFVHKDGADPRATVVVMMRKSVDQKAVAADRKSRLALSLFGDALRRSLLDLLREKLGETYSPGANTRFSPDYTTAIAQIYFQAEPGREQELEKLAMEQLNKALADGVSEDLFQKTKEGLIRDLETSLESNSYWQVVLERAVEHNTGLDGVANILEIAKAITINDVNAAGKRFVAPESAFTAIHRPKK